MSHAEIEDSALGPQSNEEDAGPSSANAQEVLFSRELSLIMAVQSLFGVSFSSFLILPKFLKVELQASAQEIGWMAAAALGAAAFFSPFVGAATSRFDRRFILTLAIVAEASAALLYVAVDHVGPFSLLLRCAQGLAFVAVFTGNSSLVADTVPNHQLSRALGYLGASMLVTNALAPLLAEPIADELGWNYVFFGAAAMSASTLFLIMQLPPRTVESARREEQAGLAPGQKATFPIQLGSLLMGAGLGVMFTYLQPFALQQGATDVGQLFLGYAAAATAVRVLLGGVSDRIGPAKVAAGALGLYSLTVLAASQLTPGLLIYLGVALGVSHGFLYPALTAAGLCVVQREQRGRFLGWFAFCFNAGFAVTVLLLGPAADRYGYAPIFLVTGAALAGGVLPLLRFAPLQRSLSST